MTIEETLKKVILSRYKSIREFTIRANIPYSTLDSIFKRGIGNSSVINVIKICKALGISADALAEGKIESFKTPKINNTEIDDIIGETKEHLLISTATINGKPVDIEVVENIIDAIDVAVEVAKRKNVKS